MALASSEVGKMGESMQKQSSCVSFALSIAALIVCFACAQTGAAARVSVNQSSIPSALPRSFLAYLASTVRPTAAGATGRNRGRPWTNAGEQRVTDRAISMAVISHDSTLVTKAFSVANYTFAHQLPSGAFEAAGFTPLQMAATTAFAIRDLSHSLLLLRDSSWFAMDPSNASLRMQADGLRAKISSSLDYLIANQQLLQTDGGATNRLLVYAGAFYLSADLLNRVDALAAGRALLGEALAKQTVDGTFLESGGFDSSYQCVSLYEAELIYLYMPQSDALRAPLRQAIIAGMARESRSVMQSGEISTVGNTRVGAQSNAAAHGGPVHAVDAIDAGLAFLYYGIMFDNVQARTQGTNIIRYYFKIN